MEKTTKRYLYYVSYAYVANDNTIGFGGATFSLRKKISEGYEILDIRDDIQKMYNFKSVTVINYKLVSKDIKESD